jgi:hypothetical protein
MLQVIMDGPTSAASILGWHPVQTIAGHVGSIPARGKERNLLISIQFYTVPHVANHAQRKCQAC